VRSGGSWACRSYILLMLGLFPLLGGGYGGITGRKTLLFLAFSAGFLLFFLLEQIFAAHRGRSSPGRGLRLRLPFCRNFFEKTPFLKAFARAFSKKFL